MNKTDEDFGFSLVDDDFVPPKVEKRMHEVHEDRQLAESRLNDVMDLILPFVNNLCADPSKTTIYWPNRVEKMEAFKARLIEAAGGAKLGNE
jgi:hypothetical protein